MLLHYAITLVVVDALPRLDACSRLTKKVKEAAFEKKLVTNVTIRTQVLKIHFDPIDLSFIDSRPAISTFLKQFLLKKINYNQVHCTTRKQTSKRICKLEREKHILSLYI